MAMSKTKPRSSLANGFPLLSACLINLTPSSTAPPLARKANNRFLLTTGSSSHLPVGSLLSSSASTGAASTDGLALAAAMSIILTISSSGSSPIRFLISLTSFDA